MNYRRARPKGNTRYPGLRAVGRCLKAEESGLSTPAGSGETGMEDDECMVALSSALTAELRLGDHPRTPGSAREWRWNLGQPSGGILRHPNKAKDVTG